MKNVSRSVLCSAIALAFAGSAVAAEGAPTRYIVQMKDAAGMSAVANTLAAQKSNRIHHRLGSVNALAVTLDGTELAALRNDPRVKAIEIDQPRYPMAQVTPYGVPMVQAPELVATGADGSGIKVCIIDSGILASHEDFAGVAMTGQAGTSWNNDTCGHGTHVAGTIAAANNNTGVIGVSPGAVSLHMVQVFSGESCAWSYASSLIAAAQECQSAGARIISMSLGGGAASTTERNAFDSLNAAGILSIAAAGNAGNSTMSYPASYSSVLSVAAVDSAGVKADFSQYNSEVDISAPGVGVLSTYPISEGGVSFSGASYMATAMTDSPALSRSGAVVDGGLCDSVGAWSGKVVLCQRGTIAFADKVLNAQSGGATAAIVYNNVSGGFGGTLNGAATSIPSVSMSMEDGQEIKASRLGQTATVSTIKQGGVSAYATLDGTSMATPHVSGVAAIVWSAKPTATNTEVRNALTSTALDLGTAGRDNDYGYGLVQAMDAADALVNGGGTEPPPATAPSNLTGSKSRKGKNYSYRLNWSGGASTVDIYRGSTKVRSAVSNTFTYSESIKTSSATYKVCNAGTTTCSNSVTL